jgi:hypothetical protein
VSAEWIAPAASRSNPPFAGRGDVAYVVDLVSAVDDTNSAHVRKADVGQIESVAAGGFRERIHSILRVRVHGNLAGQPFSGLRVVGEFVPSATVGTQLNDSVLHEHRPSFGAYEKSVFENHQVVARAVDDNIVFEGDDDRAAVAERHHVHRPFERRQPLGRAENHARQHILAEPPERTGRKIDHAIDPRVTRMRRSRNRENGHARNRLK